MRASARSARDIIELVALIDRTLARMDRVTFLEDEDAQDAVAFRLLHIGEAAGTLAPEARALAADVPWQLIAGMRNRLAHDYLGTKPSVLWETAINSLPPLAAACRAIIAESQL